MGSLLTRLRFLASLVRRLPAVIQEGRLPRRPGELLEEIRLSFQAFTTPILVGTADEPAVRRPRSGAVRVLLLTRNLSPVEGAPLSLFSLARGLSAAGYDPLIASMEDGALRASAEAEGLAVEIVNPLLGTAGAQDYPEYEARMERLGRWVKASGVRLVFCNTLASFWGVPLARMAGIPSVWCIRESVDWRTYFGHLAPALAREAVEALRTADRLIFVADATRRLFAEFEKPGRTHTIHNGIDVMTIEAFKGGWSKSRVRSAHRVEESARVISVIGTTCERKAQLDFLRAAAVLTRQVPGGLRFYVVGARRGTYLSGLRAFVRKHRLGSVVFVEETPTVFDYYRMSDVFVCTSHEESFPRVILEAMAFQLPIVSTNVQGIPEALTDDVNALLVVPGDVEALASRVKRLLAEPQLSERLSRNAYTTLMSRFTVDRMLEEYDRLLAGCLI